MAEPSNQDITLPTVEELSTLPNYSQVAYVTRCALRVLPMIKEPHDSAITLERVLLFCSLHSLNTKNTSLFTAYAIRIVHTAKAAAKAASNPASNAPNPAVYAAYAANTAVNAANPAVFAAFAANAANAAANATESFFDKINISKKEARSDFEDLRKINEDIIVENADRIKIRDFYSKPLWAQLIKLNESEVPKIEEVVGEWIEFVQAQSKPMISLHYWHFFDSKKYNEIPWFDIEIEVREWLEELEKDQTSGNQKGDPYVKQQDLEIKADIKPSLNADGTPSSLGSGMSDIDLLGRQNLVDSLASMITSPKQDTPFTIGLLGNWGSGKSNVMHLLRKALSKGDDKERFYFADFNAWEYENTDNMAAGVAQEVLKGLLEEQSFWEKFRIRWEFGKNENGVWLPIILISIIVVALISLIMILLGEPQGWIAVFGVSSVIIAGFIKHIFTILEHPLTAKVNSYLKLPSYAVHLGTIPMLKRHLLTLCNLIIPYNKKNPNRLIVFVDDLDRCEPQAISKTLDAIRLVMDIENVVVIIGIDPRIAFRAVEKQYMELADDERTSADIARDYLGKIIQLPVILNQPSENELDNFISNSLFEGIADPSEIEKQEELNTNTEPDEAVENRKESNVTDEQTATNESEDESGSIQVDEEQGMEESVKEERESAEIDNTDTEQIEHSEDMAETGEEKLYFSELCKLFGLHNPRKLKRLRNCYRLLKRIYRLSGNDWKPQMTMLFWLEFLYGQKQEDRIRIEKCMLDRDADSLASCLRNREIQSEQIAQRIIDQFELENGNYELYSKIEKQVKRLVLPHSESAKRAKEEEQTDADDKTSKKGDSSNGDE